jgi:hypothetical protein
MFLVILKNVLSLKWKIKIKKHYLFIFVSRQVRHMPEVRPFFQKAMLLSEVGWNTPPFLTTGAEEPNDFLSPGSEMKWTPLHLGDLIS